MGLVAGSWAGTGQSGVLLSELYEAATLGTLTSGCLIEVQYILDRNCSIKHDFNDSIMQSTFKGEHI